MGGQPNELKVRRARNLTVGPVSLDLMVRKAYVAGNRVPLTAREYDVLELLLQSTGTVLTKEDFLQRLYGGVDGPDAKIIDVFVCKIRRKLRDATGGNGLIDTVWGRGYVVRHEGRLAPRRSAVAHEGRSRAAG